MVEINVYMSDGSLWNKVTSIYDGKGNNIETNSYTYDGTLERKVTSKYNENGKDARYKKPCTSFSIIFQTFIVF